MPAMKCNTFPAVILAFVLLSGGCGSDVIIDVNTLPCGTAMGNAASGNFSYSGLIAGDDCDDIPAFITYGLLEGAMTVVVNHYEPGVEGCPHGRLEVLFPAQGNIPEFTLKGGLWSDGSFRIGQAVNIPTGEIYRILFDGKYSPFEEGDPPQNYFSGSARVDITLNEIDCTYEVDFTANREH